MGQLFIIIGLLNQYLPAVIQTVKSVETMFPDAGSGKSKLDMVISILNDAHDVTNSVAPPGQQISFGTILPALTNIIGHVVSFFNKTSWSAPVPVIASPAPIVQTVNTTIAQVNAANNISTPAPAPAFSLNVTAVKPFQQVEAP
jgi:hypothetical protein